MCRVERERNVLTGLLLRERRQGEGNGIPCPAVRDRTAVQAERASVRGREGGALESLCVRAGPKAHSSDQDDDCGGSTDRYDGRFRDGRFRGGGSKPRIIGSYCCCCCCCYNTNDNGHSDSSGELDAIHYPPPLTLPTPSPQTHTHITRSPVATPTQRTSRPGKINTTTKVSLCQKRDAVVAPRRFSLPAKTSVHLCHLSISLCHVKAGSGVQLAEVDRTEVQWSAVELLQVVTP